MDIMTFVVLVFGAALICAICWGLWYLLKQVPMAPPVRLILLILFAFGCVLVALHYLPAGLVPSGHK